MQLTSTLWDSRTVGSGFKTSTISLFSIICGWGMLSSARYPWTIPCRAAKAVSIPGNLWSSLGCKKHNDDGK